MWDIPMVSMIYHFDKNFNQAFEELEHLYILCNNLNIGKNIDVVLTLLHLVKNAFTNILNLNIGNGEYYCSFTIDNLCLKAKLELIEP